MPFKIIRNDITRVAADAIVNTANPDPIYADGTDRAIYEAAGAQQLLEERRKIGKIHPGEAAATDAFALRARYIIHTVGPVWKGGNSGEFETLASCYRKSLHLPAKKKFTILCRKMFLKTRKSCIIYCKSSLRRSIRLYVRADCLYRWCWAR